MIPDDFLPPVMLVTEDGDELLVIEHPALSSFSAGGPLRFACKAPSDEVLRDAMTKALRNTMWRALESQRASADLGYVLPPDLLETLEEILTGKGG
jgi:hypothetical protein